MSAKTIFRLLRVVFVSTLIFVLAGFGCSSSVPSETSKEPATILSLYPAITETIYYLDAQEYLMGRSDYCRFPKKAQDLPSFGTSLTPNFETIALHQPDRILTDQSMGTPLEELQRITPVLQYPWLTVDEMKKSIVQLGTLVKKPKEAQQLAMKMDEALQSTATPQSPTMLVIMAGSDLAKGQIWYMRRDSLHGAAIEAAGYQNAAPDTQKGPPSMSVEKLLEVDPDIILFMTAQLSSPETVSTLKQSISLIPALKSVQKRQIGVLNGENLMGVGPGILDLVDRIRSEGKILLEGK